MGARTNADATSPRINRLLLAAAIAAIVALLRERQFAKNRRATGR